VHAGTEQGLAPNLIAPRSDSGDQVAPLSDSGDEQLHIGGSSITSESLSLVTPSSPLVNLKCKLVHITKITMDPAAVSTPLSSPLPFPHAS
jgi:hypothetical protein